MDKTKIICTVIVSIALVVSAAIYTLHDRYEYQKLQNVILRYDKIGGDVHACATGSRRWTPVVDPDQR